MKKWKYAVSSSDIAPSTAPILLIGTICENMKTASKLGYDAIEIHMRPDDEFDIKEIWETERECGAKVAMVITGRLNTEAQCSFLDARPYVVDAAIKGMKEYIDFAQQINAHLVVGWVKGNVPAGGNRKKYMNRLAKNFKIVADYARERDVKINVEVINRYETNIFNTADELMTFLEEYQIENVYAHLDTFHMGIEETDMFDAIRRCKGKIGYVHLAENTRRYPGAGKLDFKKVLEVLEEVGYDGYLSIECLPWPSGEEAAKQALIHMKKVEANSEVINKKKVETNLEVINNK